MAEGGVVGTFNFVNPGVITNHQILESYKRHVDETKTWALASAEEVKEFQKTGRPNHHLDTTKLTTLFPQVSTITQSIDNLMIRLKKNQQREGGDQPNQSNPT